MYEENSLALVKEEELIYNALVDNDSMSRVEIEKETGFERSKVLRLMTNLMNKGLVDQVGSGPSTAYIIK